MKNLLKWLPSTVNRVPEKKYSHRLLKENAAKRKAAINELKYYVDKAHEDAKKYIAEAMNISLDPLNTLPTNTILDLYPSELPEKTLKGYFGEIMAGVIAENLTLPLSRRLNAYAKVNLHGASSSLRILKR